MTACVKRRRRLVNGSGGSSLAVVGLCLCTARTRVTIQSALSEGALIEQRLDIHPGVGIGPIRHGMRPAEVLAVFPEPQVYEHWMGGNLNDALLFRGLRLHFGKCDSHAPLPDSALNWVVIHQRPDACLFGRPVGAWTKESVLMELRAWGYDAQTLPNGDVDAYGQLGLSFDDDGRLIWVEV
jgi:hypothetical protein